MINNEPTYTHLRFVLIDPAERRVVQQNGYRWIFDTLAQDPRTIGEFIEAEKRLSGCSAFGVPEPAEARELEISLSRSIARGAKTQDSFYHTYAPDADIGTDIPPRIFPTIMADLRSRQVTILANPIVIHKPTFDRLSKESDERGEKGSFLEDLIAGDIMELRYAAAATERCSLVSESGEQYYYSFGLLSGLREGVAQYGVETGRELKPAAFFANGEVVIAEPEIPTKENPEEFWIAYGAARDGRVHGIKAARWYAEYYLPQCWHIIDKSPKATFHLARPERNLGLMGRLRSRLRRSSGA